jgi:polyhydroxyalkanoate synthesis regulator phasin
MTVDEVRRYMEAAVGKMSPKKAQELAKSLTKGQGKEQVTKAAQDLMAWSNKNRERLSELKQLGVASRDEVDALRRRVRDLEKAKKAPAAKRSSAKAPTTKASARPAPKATAPKTPAEGGGSAASA